MAKKNEDGSDVTLADLTVPQLHEVAREAGLEGYSSLNKGDLVDKVGAEVEPFDVAEFKEKYEAGELEANGGETTYPEPDNDNEGAPAMSAGAKEPPETSAEERAAARHEADLVADEERLAEREETWGTDPGLNAQARRQEPLFGAEEGGESDVDKIKAQRGDPVLDTGTIHTIDDPRGGGDDFEQAEPEDFYPETERGPVLDGDTTLR
jgi:hypothetical protein